MELAPIARPATVPCHSRGDLQASVPRIPPTATEIHRGVAAGVAAAAVVVACRSKRSRGLAGRTLPSPVLHPHSNSDFRGRTVCHGSELTLGLRPFGHRPETILPEKLQDSKLASELACCTDALLQSGEVANHGVRLMDSMRSSNAVGLYGDEIDRELLRGDAKSRVTSIVDASVALAICKNLAEKFPDDAILCDFDTSVLVDDDAFAARVQGVLQEAMGETVLQEDIQKWNSLAASYDAHVPDGGEPPDRYWVVSPVDSVSELRDLKSYAISVALIEAGKLVVSGVYSPNTTFHHSSRKRPSQDTSIIFFAVNGHGGYAQMVADKMKAGSKTLVFKGRPWPLKCSEKINYSHNPLLEELGSDQLRIGHKDKQREDILHDTLRVCKIMGSEYPWMNWSDNALRWCNVAQGTSDAFWDFGNGLFDPSPTQLAVNHAAGALIAMESGVSVTDLDGAPLEWTGKVLEKNRGILALDASTLPLQTMLRAIEKSTKISTEEYNVRCAKRKELAKSFKYVFKKIQEGAATDAEKEAAAKVNQLSKELLDDDDAMMDHTVKEFINRGGVRDVKVD